MSDAEERYEAAAAAFRSGGAEAVWQGFAGISRLEILETILVAFNRRDIDLLVAGRAEDGVHDMRPAGIPGIGVYRGREGYRQFLEQWLEAFSEAQLTDVEVEAADRADGSWCWFFRATQVTEGAASGAQVQFENAGAGIMVPRGPVVYEATWSSFDTDVERCRALYKEIASGAAIPDA